MPLVPSLLAPLALLVSALLTVSLFVGWSFVLPAARDPERQAAGLSGSLSGSGEARGEEELAEARTGVTALASSPLVSAALYHEKPFDP